jgi:sugar lactone lactonase YvrE
VEENTLQFTVTSAAYLSIFAGGNYTSAGSANGVGTVAQFNVPIGVAVDTLGYVYVTELYGNRVRMISPAGE